MALTQVDQGLLGQYAQYTGFKNRIINGAMVIDQRNAGASVSISNAANTYTLDRWRANANGGGVFTVQRSSVAPAGFVNSLLATVTTADSSVASGDFYHVRQTIEGLNFYDLNFGTASAKSVTISFWVRSSVTGTYTILLRNEAGNRGYLSTYTIDAANTFEQKTVTIPGDTTGTWPTDNTGCAIVSFPLGNGNTQTTNTWLSTVTEGATGMTQWIATNGATFYITGVQLEKGSTATSFDYRPYGTELQLCQRYCYVPTPSLAILNGTITAAGVGADFYLYFPVTMRAAPTMPTYPSLSNIGVYSYSAATSKTPTAITTAQATQDKILVSPSWTGGLTAGSGVVLDCTNGLFVFSSEL